MPRLARLLALALLAGSAPAAAQTPIPTGGPVRDTVIDAARRAWVLDTLVLRLRDGYVFPEKVPPLARELRARAAAGRYDAITSAVAFADTLTAHLRELGEDRHLRVLYSDRRLPRRAPGPEPTPTPEEAARRTAALRERARAAGHGLGRVELLPGNVGLVEVRLLGYPPEIVADAYRDAMARVADADAVIIDLRANGGGTPYAGALLASYLFGDDSVHLNSIWWRPENRTEEIWTRPDLVRGRRRPGPRTPVAVLTSARTFSAAEELAYDLQSRGRAIVVGETTRGGANPGGGEILDDHFGLFVPSGRAINPVTGTNWEGVGVEPDVAAPADAALDAALRELARRRAAITPARPRGAR
jgi:hypothetical protein